jgi:hypothetical protein
VKQSKGYAFQFVNEESRESIALIALILHEITGDLSGRGI